MGCGFELRMRIRFCPYKEISAKAQLVLPFLWVNSNNGLQTASLQIQTRQGRPIQEGQVL